MVPVLLSSTQISQLLQKLEAFGDQSLQEIHTYYMFTVVKENLKKFLQITDIVEWENATFRIYPCDFHQILKDVANKRGFRVMYAGFIFCLYKVNASKLKQRCYTFNNYGGPINFQKCLNMVPVLLSSTQISQLLQKLEAFGDQSLQVRSVILLEKRYPVEQFQVWVDLWPEFTTILLKQKLSETHPHNYYMFTLVKDNLKKFLQITDIVEWENAIFRVYPCDVHQILEDVVNKRGFSLEYPKFIFNLCKFNASKLKERPVPEDVTVGSLTLDMADMVAKDWYGSHLYQDKTLSHVKYLITTYPSVCVYDSKGTPIAYELGQECGGLGILFVEPAYRKRGLGKLVTNLLVQKYVDLGYQPFVYINDNNDVSIKLHVDLGFEQTDNVVRMGKSVPQ